MPSMRPMWHIPPLQRSGGRGCLARPAYAAQSRAPPPAESVRPPQEYARAQPYQPQQAPWRSCRPCVRRRGWWGLWQARQTRRRSGRARRPCVRRVASRPCPTHARGRPRPQQAHRGTQYSPPHPPTLAHCPSPELTDASGVRAATAHTEPRGQAGTGTRAYTRTYARTHTASIPHMHRERGGEGGDGTDRRWSMRTRQRAVGGGGGGGGGRGRWGVRVRDTPHAHKAVLAGARDHSRVVWVEGH
jgi:hypothetical protein